MRLFVAIELSNDIRRELAALSKALKERSCGGRFVPAENFHVTLQFIGETDDIAGAAEAVREAARDIRPFGIKLGEYGFFDRTRAGARKVALVSVIPDSDELNILHEALASALADRGFNLEHRRFVPHITLGRSVEHDELVTEELRSVPLSASMEVAGITLFESVKQNGKQVYLPLHRERF